MDAFPNWATPGENRKLFGKAKGFGADTLTLSDRDATLGFLESKESSNADNKEIYVQVMNQSFFIRVPKENFIEKIQKEIESHINSGKRNGLIDLSHHKLYCLDGAALVNYESLIHRSTYVLEAPSKLLIISACAWDSEQLDLLKVQFTDVAYDEFLQLLLSTKQESSTVSLENSAASILDKIVPPERQILIQNLITELKPVDRDFKDKFLLMTHRENPEE